MAESISNGFFSFGDTSDTREPAEIKIPVPWGHVSGKWWGPRDKQPVLALHGWQDNAGTWDTLAPLLPADVALLAVDLPGHGLSSHLPAGMQYYLFWDGVILIRRIVKYFNWEKITLLGHSLGGALSFLYAASYPDEVDRYISLDIASPSVRDMSKVVVNTGKSIDTSLKYEKLSPDSVPCYSYEDMVKTALAGYGDTITEESCRILLRRGMRKADDRPGYYFSRDVKLKVSLLGMFSLDHVMEYAAHVRCRVLNVRAFPGMKWENPSYYNIVLDKLRETAQLTYHEVQGTHHVHLNEPEKVVNYIVEFLKD